MPVNSTHAEYESNLSRWSRARDVLAGEEAIKTAGEKYLPRLDSQSEAEYQAYKARALFFNATARTAEGFVGMIFRRPPVIRLGNADDAPWAGLLLDIDLLGTSLYGYAKQVVAGVVAVGRAGTMIDWSEAESRAYLSYYSAEAIRNWRVERIEGRNVLTLVVLGEVCEQVLPGDDFESVPVEQLRVLRLEPVGDGPRVLVVECWQFLRSQVGSDPVWTLVSSVRPLRFGQPLRAIPFVFHGSRHSRPAVDELPLKDVIPANLDHYRLNADYKHGVHFTALPTAWACGFGSDEPLRIGSPTAWLSDTAGATAGFLEFTGKGLTTFETAMDRDERLMAVLGARLLEAMKNVGESAQAIQIRHSGHDSILAYLATSVSESLTAALKWVYWWHTAVTAPETVPDALALMELNTDFETAAMNSKDLVALVAARQAGEISRDTFLDALRRGEVLPDGRSNAEETKLIEASLPARVGEG